MVGNSQISPEAPLSAGNFLTCSLVMPDLEKDVLQECSWKGNVMKVKVFPLPMVYLPDQVDEVNITGNAVTIARPGIPASEG